MKLLTTALASMLFATTPLAAQPPRPAADVARDASRKPTEMVTFAKIAPGKKVADFLPGGGYFTRIFAAAVGSGGKVIAVIPPARRQADPAAARTLDEMAGAGLPQVSVAAELGPDLAGTLDVVWTAQNYHDLYGSLSPEQVAGFNRNVFASLKPGGYYVIIDHADNPGSGIADVKTLHRIEGARVKADVVAAGFVLDGESTVLANPADTHTLSVFDPAIRGRTDQFAYRFRKP